MSLSSATFSAIAAPTRLLLLRALTSSIKNFALDHINNFYCFCFTFARSVFSRFSTHQHQMMFDHFAIHLNLFVFISNFALMDWNSSCPELEIT